MGMLSSPSTTPRVPRVAAASSAVGGAELTVAGGAWLMPGMDKPPSIDGAVVVAAGAALTTVSWLREVTVPSSVNRRPACCNISAA